MQHKTLNQVLDQEAVNLDLNKILDSTYVFNFLSDFGHEVGVKRMDLYKTYGRYLGVNINEGMPGVEAHRKAIIETILYYDR